MDNSLLENLDKVHTTELGEKRIIENLNINTADAVGFCRELIKKSSNIIRKGKNWYIFTDDIKITVNANSFTVITAHRVKT